MGERRLGRGYPWAFQDERPGRFRDDGDSLYGPRGHYAFGAGRRQIVVSISNTQLIAKGTPLNDKLYEFIDKRNSLEVKIEELERKEARMVLDGANLDDVHGQLAKEGEALVKEMNDYVRQFIVDNFENVLGPSVFMMMCSTLPYPVMTPQIEDIMRTAPLSFKENTLVKDFLTKAKENMQLIEEQKRMKQNASVGGQK